MIVKCAQCQTRFKIPDEKVTDKGVKVRCTKCQNTFRVTREPGGEDAGGSAPPPPAAQADPFASFGVAPTPKHVEITRPGYFALGVEATRTAPDDASRPWNSMDGGLDTEDGVFREPTRIGPLPLPPPPGPSVGGPGAVALPAPHGAMREPVDTSSGLYGGAVPPGFDAPPVDMGAVPLPGVAGPRVAPPPRAQVPPPATRPPPPVALPEPDPFAEFMSGPAPAGPSALPGLDDLPAPVASPSAAKGAAPGRAAPRPPPPEPDADPFGSIEIDDSTMAGSPAFAAPPASPPSVEEDPFGSIDIDDTTVAEPRPSPQAVPPLAANPARAPKPAGAFALDDMTLPGRPPVGAPPARAPKPAEALAFDDMTLPGRPPSARVPKPAEALAFDDMTLPGRPPPARVPKPAEALAFDEMTLPGRPPSAAPAPAAPAEADPFASLDIDDATVPGRPPQSAPPPAAAPRPLAETTGFALPGRPLQGVPGAAARPGPARPPQAAPPATPGLGVGGLGHPAAQPGATPVGQGRSPGLDGLGHPAAQPGATPVGQGRSPGLDGLGRPAAQGGSSGHVPSPGTPAAASADPFALDAPPPATRPSTSGPTPPPLGGADPFASLDIGDATETGVAPAPAQDARDLFDLAGDSFGEQAGLQPTDTGRAALFGSPSESESESLSVSSLLGDVPPADTGLGVSLGRVGTSGVGQREVLDLGEPGAGAPAVSVVKPTARPEDVGIPQARPPSRVRKVTALVLNLVVAAVLVVGLGAVGLVYLREGRLDLSVLSPEQLEALFLPEPKSFVAVDVSNGLYETRAGRPVFYIRGEVENRTARPTHVRVRGAFFDGDQRVRSAEGVAGAVATPEELHAVDNAEAATALRQRLDVASVAVPPGARAPFLLVFQEYPKDLGSFRLEVTADAASAPTPPAHVAPAPTE
ncbi:zinc-ribbon domain-containing protein [Myxococcus dinghuensis]|uniref:zinc-ribbon domain-containing protein n=1 Tax=Myxococcus dinghuensis TaxID=2906761 RepID=UPI00225DE790|nr:zinc-ribbon domain-containing protein [Myxococcus dinghuensis]